MMRRLTDAAALRRLGRPEEVASAALSLVSPAGAYATGSALDLDDGPGHTNVNLDFPDG
jgi:7-alpha-hydroxysteroid dehydrogenase